MDRVERALGVALTIWAAVLHAMFWARAGPLWRDEANTFGLATSPRLGDVWHELPHDSFPLLWLMLQRAWWRLGIVEDAGLRVLGLLVGMATIALAWAGARRLGLRAPLWTLALLCTSPVVVRWGDALRAYGLGTLFILALFFVVRDAATQPTRRRVIVAALVAIASVQTLYHDAVLVFAVLVGAIVVAARARRARTVLALAAAGAAAALSLLPYVERIRSVADVNLVLKGVDFDLPWFGTRLVDATGPALVWVWAALVTALVARAAILPARPLASPAAADLLRTAALTAVVAVAGTYLFLRALGYPTLAWYYLPLLAVVAACVEAGFAACADGAALRALRAVAVVVIVVASAPTAAAQVQTRMTNVDEVSEAVARAASANDLVVVVPWTYGVSFARYAPAGVPWTTVPPIDDHRLHRYDAVRVVMQAGTTTATIAPLLARIEATLRAGHRVFFAGVAPTSTDVPPLPAAPLSPWGWQEAAYQRAWSAHVAAFLQAHAASLQPVGLPDPSGVNLYERLSLVVAVGWE